MEAAKIVEDERGEVVAFAALANRGLCSQDMVIVMRLKMNVSFLKILLSF